MTETSRFSVPAHGPPANISLFSGGETWSQLSLTEVGSQAASACPSSDSAPPPPPAALGGKVNTQTQRASIVKQRGKGDVALARRWSWKEQVMVPESDSDSERKGPRRRLGQQVRVRR